MEISLPFLKKLKTEPLYDSALLLSGIYQENLQASEHSWESRSID